MGRGLNHLRLDPLLDLAAREQFVSGQSSTDHLCAIGGSCLKAKIQQREEGVAEQYLVLPGH